MANYVLEDIREADRLEKQSQQEAYDYRRELIDFNPKEPGTILDAGCGTGMVSRYLAGCYPQAKIVGCDYSADRIKIAKTLSTPFKNVHFQQEDLTQLNFESQMFNSVICRYVIEHFDFEARQKMLKELYRTLKPGGQICIIDVDGLLFNLHPKSEVIKNSLTLLEKSTLIDLNVGRKIPALLKDAGFNELSWKIQTQAFSGASLLKEAELIKERFEHTRPFFKSILGNDTAVETFYSEYLEILHREGTTLFYNMFIVTAKKPLSVRVI